MAKEDLTITEKITLFSPTNLLSQKQKVKGNLREI
jgi:hypothetical protein